MKKSSFFMGNLLFLSKNCYTVSCALTLHRSIAQYEATMSGDALYTLGPWHRDIASCTK